MPAEGEMISLEPEGLGSGLGSFSSELVDWLFGGGGGGSSRWAFLRKLCLNNQACAYLTPIFPSLQNADGTTVDLYIPRKW